MSIRSALRRSFPWLLPPWRYARGVLEAGRSRWLRWRAERAVAAFPRTRRRSRHALPGRLIVSLTSYPPRFATLHKTLKSLLDQEVAPDLVLLWIAEGDLPRLPADVLALRKHGLSIRSCPDLRSFKKLVPALRDYPQDFIVTADDDVFYPARWLGALVSACAPPYDTIVGARAHLARFGSDGRPYRYTKWRRDGKVTAATCSNTALFLTGIGGILYPPGRLHRDAVRADLFSELCPEADDIWFFAMSELAGAKRVRTKQVFNLATWPGTQDCALLHDNVVGGGNDRQLKQVFRAYPALYSRFAAPPVAPIASRRSARFLRLAEESARTGAAARHAP